MVMTESHQIHVMHHHKTNILFVISFISVIMKSVLLNINGGFWDRFIVGEGCFSGMVICLIIDVWFYYRSVFPYSGGGKHYTLKG